MKFILLQNYKKKTTQGRDAPVFTFGQVKSLAKGKALQTKQLYKRALTNRILFMSQNIKNIDKHQFRGNFADFFGTTIAGIKKTS